MSVEPHPNFILPKDPDTKIWRYMDFAKYVSLLESGSLFFSQAKNLGDPHEASVPFAMLDRMKAEYRKLETVDTEEAKEQRKTIEHNAKMFVNMANTFAFSGYVNCWNMNRVELDAMWRVYLGNREGVAIQSTTKRFKKALESAREQIYLGKVSYMDSRKADLHDKEGHLNAFAFLLWKRLHFKADRELRAVHLKPFFNGQDMRQNPPGIPIKVDLNKLICRVIVSPQSPSWFADLVESVSVKYGLKSRKVTSQLSEPPIRRVIGPAPDEEVG